MTFQTGILLVAAALPGATPPSRDANAKRQALQGPPIVVTPRLHHLRVSEPREWSVEVIVLEDIAKPQ
jgi:hypothetical protein